MKTYGGSLKGALCSLQNPGCSGLEVAPTHKMARDAIVRGYEDIHRRLELRKGTDTQVLNGAADYSFNKSDGIYHYCNGSMIYIRSGSDPDSLQGLTADWCRMDEAARMPYEIFETLLDRVSYSPILGRGYVLITTTPYGTNWVYDLYSDAESNPDIHAETIYTIEAGLVSQERIDFARAHMDLRYFRQQYMASFETWAGLVYDGFSDENVRRCEYNPGLPVYVGLDFGWTDPCVAIWLQYDKHTGTYYILDEFVQPHVMGSRFAEMLAGKPITIAGQEYKAPFDARQVTKYITGHEVTQSTQAAGGVSMRNILEKFGVPYHKLEYKLHRTFPSFQSVRAAIEPGSGETRLFVDPKCQRTIKDFRGYHYKEVNGEPVGEMPDDSPEGHKYSHTMDALRYVVNTLTPIEPQFGWS